MHWALYVSSPTLVESGPDFSPVLSPTNPQDVRNIVGDATDAIERGYKNNILYTRNYKPLPSVALIMQQLRVVPNKSLFYSGLGGYQAVARQIAKAKGLQILEDSWIDRNYPNTWKGSPDEKIFWFRSSEAFALLSKGTTYVCLSKDVGVKNFHEKSIWAMIEFPTLLKNPDVTAIIRVDVDDFLSKQQPHSRSQGVLVFIVLVGPVDDICFLLSYP